MEIIVDEKCHISQPFINKNALNITSNDSIIVFSGASNNGKKWSPSNFSKLCELIILKLNTKIILAGGKDDVSEGIEIMKEVSAIELSNQIGSLSLVELCELIGGSKLLISNDTVAVHIAVSLGIPCVCIAKGDLYGRFLPYPFSISNRTHSVFPRNLSANSKNQDQWSLLNIDEVLINDVYSAVVSALTNSRILAN
jgi:ADP-heptose:LPS heptosyltransferase